MDLFEKTKEYVNAILQRISLKEHSKYEFLEKKYITLRDLLYVGKEYVSLVEKNIMDADNKSYDINSETVIKENEYRKLFNDIYLSLKKSNSTDFLKDIDELIQNFNKQL